MIPKDENIAQKKRKEAKKKKKKKEKRKKKKKIGNRETMSEQCSDAN